MKGHRPTVVLFASGLGVVMTLLLLSWIQPREPIYQGKTVGAWFNCLQNRQASWKQFQIAIDEIGPDKAWPFLLVRIRAETSWSRGIQRAVWPSLPSVVQRRWPIPTPLDDNVCRTVGLALRSSDPELVAKLVLALSDWNSHVRFTALTALKPGSDKVQVATLAKLLGDSDPEIRELAAEFLGTKGMEIRPAIPQLITALADPQAGVRFIAASLVGRLGPDGKAAVPALQVLLKDTDWEVRRKAAGALWEIDHETNAITTVIVDADNAIQLRAGAAREAPESTAAMNMLNELGASVKPAVPTILQSIVVEGEKTPIEDEFHRRVREIIARIAPDGLKAQAK